MFCSDIDRRPYLLVKVQLFKGKQTIGSALTSSSPTTSTQTHKFTMSLPDDIPQLGEKNDMYVLWYFCWIYLNMESLCVWMSPKCSVPDNYLMFEYISFVSGLMKTLLTPISAFSTHVVSAIWNKTQAFLNPPPTNFPSRPPKLSNLPNFYT